MSLEPQKPKWFFPFFLILLFLLIIVASLFVYNKITRSKHVQPVLTNIPVHAAPNPVPEIEAEPTVEPEIIAPVITPEVVAKPVSTKPKQVQRPIKKKVVKSKPVVAKSKPVVAEPIAPKPEPVIETPVVSAEMLAPTVYSARTINSLNMSFWAGAGLLFPVSNIRNYIYQPTPQYKVGFSKSIYNFTPQSFLYAGLIFSYADSRLMCSYNTLENIIRYGCSKSTYTATNEELIFGIEQTLGTPYVAGFLEIGGVFEQRYLLIENKKSEIIPGYAHFTTFGGTGNIGFTFRLFPENSITYYLRVGVNLMISPTKGVIVQNGFEKININPISYAPFAALAIRI